ncbi:hypothetical protein DFH07DRAFT_772985 [Mycena maculata]|uniref:Glucose-methanol-choline oxidoreductase C-terminal domain-containing protein n=1 Tax=Mycena maculata TaxID=230809 RepID=A0AAD7J5H4_9AGAR|nr:hypothetical protein DFH07DRAFT_772985 [Mycena maculata]
MDLLRLVTSLLYGIEASQDNDGTRESDLMAVIGPTQNFKLLAQPNCLTRVVPVCLRQSYWLLLLSAVPSTIIQDVADLTKSNLEFDFIVVGGGNPPCQIVSVAQVSNKTFNYVVVGGGVNRLLTGTTPNADLVPQTSGLTLAVRLTEDPHVSVLIIEAGPANLDDPAICSIPFVTCDLMSNAATECSDTRRSRKAILEIRNMTGVSRRCHRRPVTVVHCPSIAHLEMSQDYHVSPDSQTLGYWVQEHSSSGRCYSLGGSAGVAHNIQEHMFAGVTRELCSDISSEYLTSDSLSSPEELLRQRELYKTTGTGLLGVASSCIAFLPLSSLDPASTHTSAQDSIIRIADKVSSSSISEGLCEQYQLHLKHLADDQPSCEFILLPDSPAPGKQYLTMSAMFDHPFSCGTIACIRLWSHITSSDALSPPTIDPHYFEEESDLKVFREQIKHCLRVLDQEPLKSLVTGTEVNPGPEVQVDEQIGEYLKSVFATTWHEFVRSELSRLEKQTHS